MTIVACKFIYVKNDKMVSVGKATNYLVKSDPELEVLFNSIDIAKLTPEVNYFKSLCRSVVYQQLSGKAAGKIFFRFKNLYKEKLFPEPVDILNTDQKKLKSVGLSQSKINYIKNISQDFIKNKSNYAKLDNFSDNEIMEQLTKIKGVGPWTVQMFLIFTLNRLDVFPTGDLGVRKGYQIYFNLNNLPTHEEMNIRSQKWKPYRTYMSLYFWKILEGPFEW
tara:strand:- start:151 stop:813 length:663 start_codon:yes stop_codon:yes gene_type:complete